jgi:Spy/CpxP family protein refolding chaperone
MFSILFGLACVAGLIHLNRDHLPGRRGRCHGHHEHHDHHGHHKRRGWGGRFAGRKLDRALRSVKATPEQAADVRGVFDDLRAELSGVKAGLQGQRRDLAEALRDDSLHEERVELVFTAQRDALEGAQGAIKRALDRVHAILDPAQRARVADLLAGQRPAPAGPYR